MKTWCEHPQYNGKNDKYFADVAVLMFDMPFEFNKFVSPICLPASASLNEQAPSPGTKCLVTGWGKTEDDSYATVLQQAIVPVISRRTVCSLLIYI